MDWRRVEVTNRPVDAELLNEHLLSALSVDTYDRDARVSVFPFTYADVRQTSVHKGWGFTLTELNLRTDGIHVGHGGVYSFSPDVTTIASPNRRV